MELFKNGNLQGSEIAPKINKPFVLSKFMALVRLKMRSLTYYDSSKKSHMKNCNISLPLQKPHLATKETE
jgi:hypothetical protein